MVRSARRAAWSRSNPVASRRSRRGASQLSKLACTAARIGSLRVVTSSAVVATGQPRSKSEASRPAASRPASASTASATDGLARSRCTTAAATWPPARAIASAPICSLPPGK